MMGMGVAADSGAARGAAMAAARQVRRVMVVRLQQTLAK